MLMMVRLISTAAVALVVASPAWPADAYGTAAWYEAQQYLDALGATYYTLTPIEDSYVTATFPSIRFFGLVFRQYPVAVEPPEGLNPSDLVVVLGDKVIVLTSPDELQTFFLTTLAPLNDTDAAAEAGQAWLRLTAAFTQDGFYTFSDPVVAVIESADGGMTVLGEIVATEGGEGAILMALDIDVDGDVTEIVEAREVQIGSRPL
jgi:hypothetical protein